MSLNCELDKVSCALESKRCDERMETVELRHEVEKPQRFVNSIPEDVMEQLRAAQKQRARSRSYER